MMSLLIMVPALFRFWWDKHVDMVFASKDLLYHAMSAENYSATLTNKSVEDIKMIGTMFADRVFTWKNPMIMLSVVFVVLFVIYCFLDREILKKTDGFLLFYSLVVYMVYQVGNYVMYLVSMPMYEAVYLAGYERYVATEEWFLLGITIMTLLVTMTNIDSTADGRLCVAVLCAFGVILLWPEMNDIELIYRHEAHVSGRETSRIHMDCKYQLESEKKSLVYIVNPQDNDAGY